MSQIQIFKIAGGGAGTVTSISEGAGITLTPNPITNAGTVALTIPVSIADGGTNATSMTNTDGVVYYDGTKLNTTTVGTAGQILTSNGVGMAPTFQSGAGSAISITGDSGGPLVSGSFTFTASGIGLSFAGAGTTLTLGGTLTVPHGGTGATSLTGVLIGNGTSAITGNAIIQHDVLVGGASNAITSVTPSTAGYVLTSNGVAADPSFQALPATSITITGDTGGALAGNAFTFTGGATGLAFNGAGTTETLGGTLAVAHGGTNATSFANTDGVVYFDGTRLNTTTVGVNGYVLTSSGPGFAPSFSSLPATSITITGDSGGGLTGNSFTFTGGSTGLTFAGFGETETLTGVLDVNNGGTGATTLTGVLIGNGTSAVTANAVTQYNTLVGGASNAITSIATGTGGQVLTSNGASANPSYQTITPSIAWSVVTTNTAGTINSGYIANGAGTLVITLPTTAAVGTIFAVSGMNNNTGWQLAQNAGQQVFFGVATTTSGTGGYLASTKTYDTVELVCNVANTSWIVTNAIGNITFN